MPLIARWFSDLILRHLCSVNQGLYFPSSPGLQFLVTFSWCWALADSWRMTRDKQEYFFFPIPSVLKLSFSQIIVGLDYQLPLCRPGSGCHSQGWSFSLLRLIPWMLSYPLFGFTIRLSHVKPIPSVFVPQVYKLQRGFSWLNSD